MYFWSSYSCHVCFQHCLLSREKRVSGRCANMLRMLRWDGKSQWCRVVIWLRKIIWLFPSPPPKPAIRMRELNIPEWIPVLATWEKLQNSPSSVIGVRFWLELWGALGDCCNSPDRQWVGSFNATPRRSPLLSMGINPAVTWLYKQGFQLFTFSFKCLCYFWELWCVFMIKLQFL